MVELETDSKHDHASEMSDDEQEQHNQAFEWKLCEFENEEEYEGAHCACRHWAPETPMHINCQQTHWHRFG
jgi:hypothetical protein